MSRQKIAKILTAAGSGLAGVAKTEIPAGNSKGVIPNSKGEPSEGPFEKAVKGLKPAPRDVRQPKIFPKVDTLKSPFGD